MTDSNAPFRVISNFEVWLCIGAAAVAYFLLDALGHRGLGVASGAVVGVVISCAGTCWPLRKRPWFWIIAAPLAALHAIALSAIDWSIARSWTGLTIMPFMAADTLVTLAIVYVAFRLFCGPSQQLFAPSVSSPRRYAETDDV